MIYIQIHTWLKFKDRVENILVSIVSALEDCSGTNKSNVSLSRSNASQLLASQVTALYDQTSVVDDKRMVDDCLLLMFRNDRFRHILSHESFDILEENRINDTPLKKWGI